MTGLPKDSGKTLADQDDSTIWLKFNILLQAVDELTTEHGHAGKDKDGKKCPTTQLRIVTAELLRRDMFGISVREREPTDEQLWTWYEVTKQFIEGVSKKAWEAVEGTEKQYRELIAELKNRGHTMPAQTVQLEALDMMGTLIPFNKMK